MCNLPKAKRLHTERSGLPEGLLYIGYRIERFYVVPCLNQLPLLVKEKGGADDSHVLLAVHRFVSPGPEGFGCHVFGVGEKGKIEIILFLELFLFSRLVRTDTMRPVAGRY